MLRFAAYLYKDRCQAMKLSKVTGQTHPKTLLICACCPLRAAHGSPSTLSMNAQSALQVRFMPRIGEPALTASGSAARDQHKHCGKWSGPHANHVDACSLHDIEVCFGDPRVPVLFQYFGGPIAQSFSTVTNFDTAFVIHIIGQAYENVYSSTASGA